MSNISNYLEEQWLNMLRGTAYAAPATFAGLVSSVAVDADMEAGTLTHEITGYTGDRKIIHWGTVAQEGGMATLKNIRVIDFENMPAVTVKYVIICDSPTRGLGNILYWCPLEALRTTNVGDVFRIKLSPTPGLVVRLG